MELDASAIGAVYHTPTMSQDKEKRKPSAFSDLLRTYIAVYKATSRRISQRSGIPRETIANWLEGRVGRPRRWQDVVAIGTAFDLTVKELDELLRVAGFSHLEELWSKAETKRDQEVLLPWLLKLGIAVSPITQPRLLTPDLPSTPAITGNTTHRSSPPVQPKRIPQRKTVIVRWWAIYKRALPYLAKGESISRLAVLFEMRANTLADIIAWGHWEEQQREKRR